MGNIADYVIWRGDLAFSKDEFNEVDALILTQLAYVEFDRVAQIKKRYALKDLAKAFQAKEKPDSRTTKSTTLQAVELLLIAGESQRFGDIIVSNYMSYLDEWTQFAAMQFNLPTGEIFVAFRGTDDSLSGWEEDFSMSFEIVPAQTRAVGYLNETTRGFYRKYYLGGHSKGGNLAVFSAISCKGCVKRRIKQVYDFDGPGFLKDAFHKEQFDKMKDLITNVVPEDAIIGALLFHPKVSETVKSQKKGLEQHDVFNWEINGTSIIRAKERTKESLAFEKIMADWLEELKIDQRRALVRELFSMLRKEKIMTMSSLRNNSFIALKTMVKSSTAVALNHKHAVVKLLQVMTGKLNEG